MQEIQALASPDDLTIWALRRQALKNKLQGDDGEIVGAAYRAKLDTIVTNGDYYSTAIAAQANGSVLQTDSAGFSDEAAFKLPKTRRRRSRKHLEFVAAQPCLVCRRTPSDAHHLKFAETPAMGRKVSDEFTVPICRDHHIQLHAHPQREDLVG